MSLPELAWQLVYARFAWSVVLAAGALGLWSWQGTPSRQAVMLVMAVSCALVALPGSWSPAFWLGLAFQMPSALLTACCVLTLWARWQRDEGFLALPLPAAGLLAAGGLWLYMDSSGWLSSCLYALGFGPVGAPMCALALGVAAAVVLVSGRHCKLAAAVLVSVTVFSLLRLPTGNLWDALLDPFLWGWAVISAGLQWRAKRAARAAHPAAMAGAAV
jgi:hypothetical protein